MKKLTILILALFAGIAANAQLRYKGYADLFSGVTIPQANAESGAYMGASTTHGVNIIDGLFVGAGVEMGAVLYQDVYDYNKKELEYGAQVAAFAEGRYTFLNKRFSPFVTGRLGLGNGDYEDEVAFYASTLVGCTFNLTKKFGFDASMGYSLHTGTYEEEWGYGNISNITFRLGIHF